MNNASNATDPPVRLNMQSPRSAGLAGIIFSLLFGASLILIELSMPPLPSINAEWLPNQAGRISLAMTLMPFGGIAFLWFIGVVRDQVGALEDKFFSTIFLGSGLLFLSAMFTWAAIVSAVLSSYDAASDTWLTSDAYIFSQTMLQQLAGMVALRMAGVFMMSSGTIWLRTKVMPLWMVVTTYGIALVLLLGGSTFNGLRLGFPIWVFVVSLWILRKNRLRRED